MMRAIPAIIETIMNRGTALLNLAAYELLDE